jgi:hypothetical protein
MVEGDKFEWRLVMLLVGVMAASLAECTVCIASDAGALRSRGKSNYDISGMPWGVRLDMNYLDARAQLERHGFEPNQFKATDKRVRGTPEIILRQFPEVEYCKLNTRFSCVFSFIRKSDGQYLSVFTYGDPSPKLGGGAFIENMRLDKCFKPAFPCYPPVNITPDYRAPSIFP